MGLTSIPYEGQQDDEYMRICGKYIPYIIIRQCSVFTKGQIY